MTKDTILESFYPNGFDKPFNKNKLKNKELVQALIQITNSLSLSSTFSERLFCLKNNKQPNLCECGKKTKFKTPKEGYAEFCSRKCMNKSKKVKDKRKESTIKSCGGMGFASESTNEKIRKKNKERYGTEIAVQSKEVSYKISETWNTLDKKTIQDKRKKTSKEKYGVEYHQQNEKQKEKIKTSLIDNHGGVGFSSTSINAKIKNTNKVKYGFDNAMQSEEIQQKLVNALEEKYNVSNISHNKEVIEKKKMNNLIKYGVTSNSQLHLSAETFEVITNKQKFEMGLKASKNAYAYSRELGVTLNTILSKIEYFGIDYESESSSISVAEIEILNFLQDQKLKIEQSNRKLLNGKEIDLLVSDKKIAIELNGVYWHSERKGKYKNYHLEKTKKLADLGIQLLHIWDYEWFNQTDIIKSIIKSKCRIYDTRLYARKCQIMEIDSLTKNKFLEENHLQGQDKSSFKYGLFYNGDLVSVMTFGASRYNKSYQYEMHRFCNKQGYQIVGGASRLWKYFIRSKNPESVITYADKRYSDGLLYEKIGFTLKNVSLPNFWIFGNNIKGLNHRSGWQKHKLMEKLTNFKPEITAWQNMLNHGYDRVWDCGNYVYVYERD